MEDKKKKKLFIWLSSIGTLVILILFIWSMKISISNIDKIEIPEVNLNVDNIIDNKAIEELKNQFSSEQEQPSEVQDIINLIEQDASTIQKNSDNLNTNN